MSEAIALVSDDCCCSCQTPQSGGGDDGTLWTVWQDTGPDPSFTPTDTTKAITCKFRDGFPPVTWDPNSLTWN